MDWKAVAVVSVAIVVGGIGAYHQINEKLNPPKPVASVKSVVQCPNGQESAEEWVQAIASEVKLYTGDGDCKTYIGTLVGGNGQEVLIKMASGDPAWKKRGDIYSTTWVKANDPAYKANLWRQIEIKDK